jgi:ADP-heptose:LPS heptosyltransferase
MSGSAGGANRRVESPRRVLILRALHLGDLLCAVPAFRALRQAWPSAQLVLAGLPWSRAFVDRFRSILDGFVEFPGAPGLPEQPPNPPRLAAFLSQTAESRFDLAIQMQGDGTIANDLVLRFGAREAAGFCMPGCEPASGRFASYPEDLSEVHRWILLASFLGAPPAGDHLDFPIDPADEAEAAQVMTAAGIEVGRYACLHAGARDVMRRWPAHRFAEVADALASRGVCVVLTGQASERDVAGRVETLSRERLVNLVGLTSVGSLAVLLRGSRLVVCNDTGVSHLAAAVRAPSVVIFRTTDPVRWAPIDRALHRVVADGADSVRRVLRETDAILAREGFRAA